MSDSISTLDERLLQALRRQLQAEAVQGLHVERVELERGLDADGNPAVFVNLTLADPPLGRATWPVSDVQQLRRLVRDAVLELMDDEIPRWYVSFAPTSEGAAQVDP